VLSPGGSPEVPCAKCGRRVPGLPWGDLCPDCLAERRQRASRLARWIAIAATALAAVYVARQATSDPMGRYYSLLAVVVTYILVRRVAARIAMEFLK
jgi:hypothetical protein